MAYRRKSSRKSARKPAYRKASKKRTSRAASSKKRARVKAGNRAGTVKLVIEHARDSQVARPDGLAGAFQMAAKAGRARL